MKKVISCCDPKCPQRSATCHATCKKWADYVVLRDGAFARKYMRKDIEEAVKRRAIHVSHITYR